MVILFDISDSRQCLRYCQHSLYIYNLIYNMSNPMTDNLKYSMLALFRTEEEVLMGLHHNER